MTFREKIMLACTSSLIFACMITLIRYGTYQWFIRDLGWDNAFTRTIFYDRKDFQHFKTPRDIPDDEIPINWISLYPFLENPQAPKSHPISFFQMIDKKKQALKKKENLLSSWTNDRFFNHMSFVMAKNKYDDLLHWNIPLYRDYYSSAKLPDGNWSGFLPKTDVSHFVSETTELSSFCRTYDIQFLFVLAPNKIAPSSAYNNTLDFSNQNGDEFLSGLQKEHIEQLDLRTTIQQEDLEVGQLFFKTDHHWKPETARWAAQKIEQALNDRFAYDADFTQLDPQNYTETIFPRKHLGSYGQRVTLARTAPDNFPIFFPKFSTSFHLEIPSMNLSTDGNFSILYDMSRLDSQKDVDNHYPPYVYATYLYGERAVISIKNHQKKDGKKLLLLHDSFSDAMAPFLSLGMEQLDLVDLRCFTGSIKNYILKQRPDTVVVCYTVSVLNWDKIYPRSVFDFR